MPAPETHQPPLIAEQRVLSAGLAFAVLAAVLQTVVHLANAALVESRQLNANLEGNVFAWAGTVSTFAVSFVAFVAAIVVPHLRMRFAVIAAVTAFFSLDDMVQIHERLGAGSADSLGVDRGASSRSGSACSSWQSQRRPSRRAGRGIPMTGRTCSRARSRRRRSSPRGS